MARWTTGGRFACCRCCHDDVRCAAGHLERCRRRQACAGLRGRCSSTGRLGTRCGMNTLSVNTLRGKASTDIQLLVVLAVVFFRQAAGAASRLDTGCCSQRRAATREQVASHYGGQLHRVSGGRRGRRRNQRRRAKRVTLGGIGHRRQGVQAGRDGVQWRDLQCLRKRAVNPRGSRDACTQSRRHLRLCRPSASGRCPLLTIRIHESLEAASQPPGSWNQRCKRCPVRSIRSQRVEKRDALCGQRRSCRGRWGGIRSTQVADQRQRPGNRGGRRKG